MMTPPLACMVSKKKNAKLGVGAISCRAENLGKEEDELRLDSWIQIRSTRQDKIKCSSSVLLAQRHQHSIKKP